MGSSNKVYMKASIKHANITPPSLLRLFPTAELTNQSLDAAFVAERWPTRGSMGPRGYSQLHCRADQPVTRCSLVAISGGHPMMRVSPAWVVTTGRVVKRHSLHNSSKPTMTINTFSGLDRLWLSLATMENAAPTKPGMIELDTAWAILIS